MKHKSRSTQISKGLRHTRSFENIEYQGNTKIPTIIELIQYNEHDFLNRTISSNEKLKTFINNKFINWFKITGISDVNTIYQICKEFDIKTFDIKDLVLSKNTTKVILYNDINFILISGHNGYNDCDQTYSQIAFIVGRDFIISFQETEKNIFNDVVETIENSRLRIRERKVDFLLYILLSDVHSSYNEALSELATKIDDMEDSLIEDRTSDINVMKFIQSNKREYSHLKRIISSLREEHSNLLHNSNNLIDPNNIIYFNDFDDRLRTSLDDLESFFMSLSSLTDLYFNNNNMRMNDVIKKLTIVSTIFIPLTFLVGVWGMNFHYMPELKWIHGYPFAWIIIGLTVVISILYLKFKKWI